MESVILLDSRGFCRKILYAVLLKSVFPPWLSQFCSGKLLEESGVLNESLRSRSNSWGLHMPLVCPDGAVVAYAWKRQLAGQAGASAVDRTRL